MYIVAATFATIACPPTTSVPSRATSRVTTLNALTSIR